MISNSRGPWANMMVHFPVATCITGTRPAVDMPTHAQSIGGDQLITATMVLQQMWNVEDANCKESESVQIEQWWHDSEHF